MKLRDIYNSISNFLFSRANREFLIFLFFLALSGIFWLLMTLNETYEKEFRVSVHITGVPKNAVLTSPEVDTVRVTIRDRGIVLASYIYGDELRGVSVNFKNYANNNGTGNISAQDIQKLVAARLSASSKITVVKPERIDFYFNYGEKKLVPVRWSGRVIPEELYFISDVDYSSDSITIYAAPEKLDSINMVYTEQLNYVGFRDTLSISCQLAKMQGVKMVPERINLKFMTDVLTEESIDGIPIQGINMPAGKVLRTFPSKVRVHFVTGVSVFRALTPNDFYVVADYNELKNNPSPKCNIYLRRVPDGISRAKLDLKEVDYLIEEQN